MDSAPSGQNHQFAAHEWNQRLLLACAFGGFLVMGIAGALATTLVPLVPVLFGLGLGTAMVVQWIALVVSGG
ncbi:hypothetical protein ABTE62_18860, partial [Acinetobacter baumannii]